MKYVFNGVIAIILLTACGQNDKPSGKAALASVEFDVSKLHDVMLREGDAATASEALAAFSLAESGSGRLSFDSKNIDGDKAVFTNVILSIPQNPSVNEPFFSEEEIAELFYYMDFDDDGIADDGSEMTLEDFRVSMNEIEPADLPPVIKVARLEFDGLGMVNGAANFSLMRLSGISVTPVVGTEDQSRGSVGMIELINPSPETAGWVASLLGQGEPDGFPEGAALSFDRWSIRNVDLGIREASSTVSVNLGSLYIDGLKEERRGKVGLSNLNFQFTDETSADVTIKLDGFGIAGLDFGLIAAAASSSADPAAMARVMQADPGNPGFDAIRMAGLAADFMGASVDLASFNSYVGRDAQGRATTITTEPFTMTVAARENADGEQFAGALATLGYQRLTLTAASEQRYNPETDLMTLPKGRNYWQLDDGFRLDVSAKYEGSRAIATASAAARLDADPAAMIGAMMNKLAVHQFEISLADKGFFNRALNAYAAQSGEDPANLRAQISGVMAMAPMMAGQTGIDAAVVTELATAISGFVQDPKTLTISMTPQTPLTAQTFMEAAARPSDPTRTLDKAKLGFSAANK